MPIAQGHESIEWQSLWRERDEDKIIEYFKFWHQPDA